MSHRYCRGRQSSATDSQHPDVPDPPGRMSPQWPHGVSLSGFQPPSQRSSFGPQDDDVDLEALLNDMACSGLSSVDTGSPAEPVSLPPCGPWRGDSQASSREASPRHAVHRSQPMRIHVSKNVCYRMPLAGRGGDDDMQAASLPSIPNPFPELCTPSCSPDLVGMSFPSHELVESHVIRVFSEDGTGRSLEIPAGTTAREVCRSLALKNQCLDDSCWALVESYPHIGLERSLEDHEIVAQVQAGWGSDCDNKLFFRKNYAKYEFFKNPVFFPEHMASTSYDTNGTTPHSQIIQNLINASGCPEIQGYLHVKDPGRKSWKKLYCFLRPSGLYYSTKGTSREPRHLQCCAELSDSNVYTVVSGKKIYSTPSDFAFCIKPNRTSLQKELKVFCAEDEQSRTCWVTTMRLFKYGTQLHQNYHLTEQRRSYSTQTNNTPMRNISDNTLVAMDFSGRKGRVIDNPSEALSAAMEEGQAWRRRSSQRFSIGSPSPCQPSALNSAIHKTQLWFHGRITREEAQRIITQQGLVDGLFLLRDSHSNPKTFVLSLCHHQKIKHFQILPFEEDGSLFFSTDEGHTKFSDLIQLVEFYTLNRGPLPCRLKHHCTRVAL
uniref:growth factor receptor-bound protein 10-like isoform X2 n=1 Tax=Myxine glutinosa TaxID=7769 RepID=UPI00358EE93C